MITHQDIKVSESTFRISLSKLIGKQIKDITGYLSGELGGVSFKVSDIILEDDTRISVEGEHDFPYLVSCGRTAQPNFDDDTLQRLRDEANTASLQRFNTKGN